MHCSALTGGVIAALLLVKPLAANAAQFYWNASSSNVGSAASWNNFRFNNVGQLETINPPAAPTQIDDLLFYVSSPGAPTNAFALTNRTNLPSFAAGSTYQYNSIDINLPTTSASGCTGLITACAIVRTVTVGGTVVLEQTVPDPLPSGYVPFSNASSGSFSLKTSGLIVLEGATIHSHGITLQSTVVNQPASELKNSGTLQLRSDSTGENAFLQVKGGTVINEATGRIRMAVKNAGTFTNNGGVISGSIFNSGAVAINGGTVDGAILNSGTVVVDGASVTGASLASHFFPEPSTNTAGSFTVKNGAQLGGGLTVSGGQVTNMASTLPWYTAVSSTISGPVVVNGGTFTNQAGSLTVGNEFDSTGAAYVRGPVTVGAGGTFNNLGIQDNSNKDLQRLTVSFARGELITAVPYDAFDGTLYTNLAGATAKISGDITTAGTFTNGGLIQGNITQTGGTFTNLPSIRGANADQHYLNGMIRGNVTISGGTFNNSGSMGSTTLTSGLLNNLAGGFVAGSVTVNGGNFSNAGLVFNDTILNSAASTITNETSGSLRNTVVAQGALFNRGIIGLPANGFTISSLEVRAGTRLINFSGATVYGAVNTAGDVFTQGTITGHVNMNGGNFTQRADQSSNIVMLNDAARIYVGDTDANALQTLSGIISGAGSLTKETGSNTVVLSGANTYSGGTAVKGGILRLEGAGSLGSGFVQVNGGSTLDFALGANDYTVNSHFNALVGIGTSSWTSEQGRGLTRKSGSGTLTFDGSQYNSLGGFEISEGTVRVGPNAVMASGIAGFGVFGLKFTNADGTTATFDSGASSRYNGATFNVVDLSGNSGSRLTGSGGLALNASTNSTQDFKGTIDGYSSLIKAGSGTQVLSGTNTYSGTTAIQGGTLKAMSAGALSIGNVIMSNGSMLELAGAQASDFIFANSISGDGGVTKSGANTVTLTGTNTYSGATSVLGGSLIIGNANALSPNTRIEIATGAVFNPGDFTLNISSLQGAGSIVEGTGTVTVNSAETNTFSGTILGDRDLVKLGVGTQVIDGNINIGGQVTAGGGTLTLTGNNIIGGGVLVTGGGKIVLGSNNAAGGSAGKITTTGSIVEYLGGVDIASQIVINSNTTQLQVATGQPIATQSGVISELRDVATPTVGRPLEKIGGGTLILTAVNTYTGMTTISGGALSVSSNANLGGKAGGLTLNGGTLITTANISDFQRAVTLTVNNGTFSPAASTQLNAKGVVSGTGRLTMAGAGTLVMEANNTYSGGTSINSGTVQVSSDANLGSAAGGLTLGSAILATTSSFTSARNVVLSAGTVGTFSTAAATTLTLTGVISDTGGLTKTGSGTLMLDGYNTHTYTGTTTVNTGKLVVNGSIVASSGLTIANGASFGGNATIRDLTLQSGATLSPGNSIGTTNVTGNLILNGGSTTAIEIQGAAMDRVVVGGTATLGGTLQLVGLGGRYSFGQAYNFLTSTGATTGTFSTLDARFGVGVASVVSYSGTGAAVTLSAVPLSPLTNSQTAGAVASAMDRAVANGANASAFSEIYSQPTSAALSQAINQLSGVSHTGASALGNQASNTLISAMFNPTAAGRSAPTGSLVRSFAPQQEWSSGQRAINDALGRSSDPVAIYTPAQNYNIWASLTGVTSRASGDAASGLPRVSSSFGGLAAGADIRIAPETTIGAVVAGATGSSSSAGGLGSVKTDMFQLGLYGSTKLGALSLAAASTWTTGEVEGSRAIPALGLASVKSNYNMQGFSGRFEATFAIANLAGITTSPYAAFQVSSIRTSSFVERNGATGAPVGLQVSAKTNTTARTELGLKLETAGQIGAMPATAFVRAGWGHYTSREANVTAQIVGLPGSQFTVTGIRPDQNVALIAAGAEVRLTPAVSIGGSLDAELGAQSSALKGSANFKYAF
jgi:autotransporter-associated beta strand protein